MRHSIAWYAAVAVVAGLASPQGAFATTPDTLSLDGVGDFLQVPNAPDLNPTGGMTVEAWVRPTADPGAPTIVGKDFATGFWLGLVDRRIRVYTDGLGTQRDGDRQLTLGRWTPVAVTFDGLVRRYYIDGALAQRMVEAAAESARVIAEQQAREKEEAERRRAEEQAATERLLGGDFEPGEQVDADLAAAAILGMGPGPKSAPAPAANDAETDADGGGAAPDEAQADAAEDVVSAAPETTEPTDEPRPGVSEGTPEPPTSVEPPPPTADIQPPAGDANADHTRKDEANATPTDQTATSDERTTAGSIEESRGH